jgi:hypothetical protein
LLPCEVVVTALAHPLCGCRVRAYAFRHVDGVPHLKVELPDGMPGLVAADATDVFGAGRRLQARAWFWTVLACGICVLW